MRRFFVEQIDPEAKICIVGGREARHIQKVLRMGPGDPLILMDRQGRNYEARIQAVSRQCVQVKLEKSLPSIAPAASSITLCQSVLKPRAMDLLIEKVSELGVGRLLPFVGSRTVWRPDAAQADAKMRHWQGVAQNAAKQCERPAPLRIESIRNFQPLLEEFKTENAFRIILWEAEESQDLKSLLKTTAPQAHFIGLVGPEGGFTEDEVVSARAAGFAPLSLGRRILRAETAGITLSALIQYEWGDLGL